MASSFFPKRITMRWGINWGFGPVTPEMQKEIALPGVAKIDGRKHLLQGIADSEEDANLMVAQATNGHRSVEKIESTRKPGWFGLYIG